MSKVQQNKFLFELKIYVLNTQTLTKHVAIILLLFCMPPHPLCHWRLQLSEERISGGRPDITLSSGLGHSGSQPSQGKEARTNELCIWSTSSIIWLCQRLRECPIGAAISSWGVCKCLGFTEFSSLESHQTEHKVSQSDDKLQWL